MPNITTNHAITYTNFCKGDNRLLILEEKEINLGLVLKNTVFILKFIIKTLTKLLTEFINSLVQFVLVILKFTISKLHSLIP